MIYGVTFNRLTNETRTSHSCPSLTFWNFSVNLVRIVKFIYQISFTNQLTHSCIFLGMALYGVKIGYSTPNTLLDSSTMIKRGAKGDASLLK